MARLNESASPYESSDDELPSLEEILKPYSQHATERRSTENSEKDSHTAEKSPSESLPTDGHNSDGLPDLEIGIADYDRTEATTLVLGIQNRQGLKTHDIFSINPVRLGVRESLPIHTREHLPQDVGRKSPRRLAKRMVNYRAPAIADADSSPSCSENEDSFTDLSGFIVPDSNSEDDAAQKRSQDGLSKRPNQKKSQNRGQRSWKTKHTILESDSESDGGPRLLCVKDSASPAEHSPREESNIEGPNSSFTRLPSRPKQSRKLLATDTNKTPPPSPSKPHLASPTKRERIPPSPYRSSIDAFWSQDVINDWNDQYSPTKAPTTPSKSKPEKVDKAHRGRSDTVSPCKDTHDSPSKRDKALIMRRKKFQNLKIDLARAFLIELDEAMTGSQVASLTASTGGIKIEWSKKLLKTAGRAHWRREVGLRNTSERAQLQSRHHARIELSEKVIDDEDRLINTMAHEYCHLATFMISGQKDHAHGGEFKRWADKCSKLFGSSHGVHVTTCHRYEIEYKYIWACTNLQCGVEFKRHSKSIDPSRHGCGKCKGKIEQIKPTPRAETEYQKYVKANWAEVKKEMDRIQKGNAKMGDVMAALSKRYNMSKAGARRNVEHSGAVVPSQVDKSGLLRNNLPHEARQKGQEDTDGLEKMAETLGLLKLSGEGSAD